MRSIYSSTALGLSVIYALLYLLLVMFSGFRVDSGTDYYAHRQMFELVQTSGEFWRTIEPGFLLLIELSNFFTKDSQIIILTSALLAITLIAYRVKRTSAFPVLSLILFVLTYNYFQSFNLVRQYIAISIYFAFAIPFIINGQLLRYVFLVILCSCFHFSAIVLMPFYYVRNVNLNMAGLIFILPILILIYLVYPYAQNFIFSAFGLYEGYSNYKDGSANYTVFMSLCMLAPALLNLNKFNSISRENRVMVIMAIASVFFMFIAHHNAIAHRVALYLNIFLILLVPAIAQSLKNTNQKIVYLTLCMAVGLVHLVVYSLNNSAGVFPYSFEFSIG